MVFDTTMNGYQFTQKVCMHDVRTSVCVLRFQHVISDFGYLLLLLLNGKWSIEIV